MMYNHLLFMMDANVEHVMTAELIPWTDEDHEMWLKELISLSCHSSLSCYLEPHMMAGTAPVCVCM